MKQFIKIQGHRIRISTIKRYVPMGEYALHVHLTASANRMDYLVFKFENDANREEVLANLDIFCI